MKTTIKDFKYLDYEGFKEPTLLQRCEMLACGRWTAKSLYNVFEMGKESGTLEHTLNHLGLRVDDLEEDELDTADRVYLIARAKNLSGIQASLTQNANKAKEAQVLLSEIYGITPNESNALKQSGVFVGGDNKWTVEIKDV